MASRRLGNSFLGRSPSLIVYYLNSPIDYPGYYFLQYLHTQISNLGNNLILNLYSLNLSHLGMERGFFELSLEF